MPVYCRRMIDWTRAPHVPRYRQVAEYIRQRIQSGEYPQHKLLSENWLIGEFGIARATARKAIGVLRDDGLVFTVPRMGSFVGQPADDMQTESGRSGDVREDR